MIEPDAYSHQLFEADTIEEIAKTLGVLHSNLSQCLSRTPDENYFTFDVPTGNGDSRVVHAPKNPLKDIQRRLASLLTQAWQPTPCSYGFLPNRSIVDNARNHVGKRHVLNIDLKDFFPSITFRMIKSMFLSSPYEMTERAANTIARIACYKTGLAQGAPSSPIISNMICEPLDFALLAIASQNNCVYSRYADDISFSSDEGIFPRKIAFQIRDEIVVGSAVDSAIKEHGFVINRRKVALAHYCAHQEVTGIVVNEKLNVRRRYVSQLRSILHNCATNDPYYEALRYIAQFRHKVPQAVLDKTNDREFIKVWFSHVLRGKVEYVRAVKGSDSPTYFMLASRYNSTFGSTFDCSTPKDQY